VPFLLVVTRELVPVEARLGLITLAGKRKPGFLDRHYADDDLPRFQPIKELEVPAGPAYLLFDVDRGEETRNLAPDAAMEVITGQGRLPLTIDEGLALVTLFPAALAKNKCFSLVGSRCGDRGAGALISQGAEARLVLVRQPAHLARLRLRPAGTGRPRPRPRLSAGLG
jgi:hypothetical protein